MIAKLQKNTKKIYRFLDHKSIGNPLIFFLMLLILPITVLGVQQTVKYLSHAAGTAEVAFAPTAINLPPDAAVKINVNGNGTKVAFARVVFTFDKTKVKLTGEITPSATLSTIVEKTTMAAANGSGRAVIVLAAAPSSTLPTGNFEFAALKFTAQTTSPGSVAVNFDSNDMQVVDDSTIPLSFSVTPLVLGLNGASPPPGGGGGGGNPQACQNRGSVECYNQWKQEYLGTLTTKVADLNSDGIVDLGDFEFWRRAAYP